MPQVIALYNFVTINDAVAVRNELEATCRGAALKGTLLVAPEGINGTLAGEEADVRAFLASLNAMGLTDGAEVKFADADEPPFLRLKVRLKREIVTLGVGDLDPASHRGAYVEPADWNAVVDDPGTVLIDTRNDYEVKLGSFEGALDPGTTRFGELPDWVEKTLDMPRDTPIAMFCTGGIRCEKSTALLRSRGFTNVRHLKGGILRYLEEVPEARSRWRGECFVFDERVSVAHALAATETVLCRGCQLPVTLTEQADPRFEKGICCPQCIDTITEEQRARFANRQRQVEQAQASGTRHIAADLKAERARKKQARSSAN